MIETHAVNSFLHADLKQTAWFQILNFANGLVAPTFLFVAGYAQGLAMRRRLRAGERVIGGWGRLAMIAGIGYALHFQAPWRWGEPGVLREAFQVDILQCLAAALALMLVFGNWARTEAQFDLGIALFFAVGVFLAPFAELIQPPNGLTFPFLNFLSLNSGFPLVPWAGFAAAGALVSRLETARTAVALLAGSAVVWVLAWLFATRLSSLYPPHQYFRTDPGFFFERLGWLFVLVVVLVEIARRWTPALLLYAGRNSLNLYVIHLLLLYVPFGRGGSWVDHIGATQSPAATLLLFAALALLSFLANEVWLRVREMPWVAHRAFSNAR